MNRLATDEQGGGCRVLIPITRQPHQRLLPVHRPPGLGNVIFWVEDAKTARTIVGAIGAKEPSRQAFSPPNKEEHQNDVIGKPEFVEVPPPLVSKELKKRWSNFIQKVYGTDPLVIPSEQWLCPSEPVNEMRHPPFEN